MPGKGIHSFGLEPIHFCVRIDGATPAADRLDGLSVQSSAGEIRGNWLPMHRESVPNRSSNNANRARPSPEIRLNATQYLRSLSFICPFNSSSQLKTGGYLPVACKPGRYREVSTRRP